MSVKVGILGTGNIGSDLMQKIVNRCSLLEIGMFAGIDPNSDGIARARAIGVPASSDGIEAILSEPQIRIVFDATTASAHLRHAPRLESAGMFAIDLTPAAVGSYFVPAVNMEPTNVSAFNINMVTCGGQGTIPIVHAVSEVAEVEYAETVSAIASVSAGPGTRANIDEFTKTTAKAVQLIGRAEKAKSIIILNPANPPILCQNTIYLQLRETPDREAVTNAVERMVEVVRRYVPGYRLKYPPLFDGRLVTVIVVVEGAGDYLPPYAGNLDIMTSAALAAGEALAAQLEEGGYCA
jgi:acetaldehyde dehydrogenase